MTIGVLGQHRQAAFRPTRDPACRRDRDPAIEAPQPGNPAMTHSSFAWGPGQDVALPRASTHRVVHCRAIEQ